MWDAFALEDLFALGLGCDIAGGILLARGLLSTPETIARRATSFYGVSPPTAVAMAQDNVDSRVGLGALLLGFLLQAAGYALQVSRDRSPTDGSTADAVAVLALVVLGCAVVIGSWRLYRTKWIKGLLVRTARCDPATRQMADRPSAERLRAFGYELGFDVLPNETSPPGAALYVERVFGVTDAQPGEQHFVVPGTTSDQGFRHNSSAPLGHRGFTTEPPDSADKQCAALVSLLGERRGRLLSRPWFTIAGLVLDFAGVLLIATAAFVTKEQAVALGPS
jgi:hypothetical protein